MICLGAKGVVWCITPAPERRYQAREPKGARDSYAKYIQLETNKNKMHTKCPAPSKSPRAPARREIDRSACVGVACDHQRRNHQRRCNKASIRHGSSGQANQRPPIANGIQDIRADINQAIAHLQHQAHAIRTLGRPRARHAQTERALIESVSDLDQVPRQNRRERERESGNKGTSFFVLSLT